MLWINFMLILMNQTNQFIIHQRNIRKWSQAKLIFVSRVEFECYYDETWIKLAVEASLKDNVSLKDGQSIKAPSKRLLVSNNKDLWPVVNKERTGRFLTSMAGWKRRKSSFLWSALFSGKTWLNNPLNFISNQRFKLGISTGSDP